MIVGLIFLFLVRGEALTLFSFQNQSEDECSLASSIRACNKHFPWAGPGTGCCRGRHSERVSSDVLLGEGSSIYIWGTHRLMGV